MPSSPPDARRTDQKRSGDRGLRSVSDPSLVRAGLQGRTKFGWFVLGMLFGPLALLILVFLTQPLTTRD